MAVKWPGPKDDAVTKIMPPTDLSYLLIQTGVSLAESPEPSP